MAARAGRSPAAARRRALVARSTDDRGVRGGRSGGDDVRDDARMLPGPPPRRRGDEFFGAFAGVGESAMTSADRLGDGGRTGRRSTASSGRRRRPDGFIGDTSPARRRDCDDVAAGVVPGFLGRDGRCPRYCTARVCRDLSGA